MEWNVEETIALAEMAWESSMSELAAFGFIVPPDDVEELEDFAVAAKWVHYLDAEFEKGNVGGAELFEYEECMEVLERLLSA